MLLHLLRNGNKVRSTDGQPVFYETDLGTHLVCEFGVLSVHEYVIMRRICVISGGREVLVMMPDTIEKAEPGPWVGILAAIAADLDARFGTHHVRHQHIHK